MRNLHGRIREAHESNDESQTHDIDYLNFKRTHDMDPYIVSKKSKKIPYWSTSLSVSNCRQLPRRTVHMYQLSLQHMGPPSEATGPSGRAAPCATGGAVVPSDVSRNLPFHQPLYHIESPQIGQTNTKPVFPSDCLI